MRVLTIINSASIGGVEKTLLSCIKNMKAEKIEMTILCFRSDGVLENNFKDLGVKFLYIKKTGLILIDMIQLFFLLLKHKFDIVHSRFGFTSGGFVLASFLAQTKVFVSIHSGEPSTFKKFKNNKLLYYALFYHLKIHKFLTLKFADKIIGHSKSNLNLNFIDWKSNPKFELVYNGVDFEELNNDLEESNNLNDFIKKEDVVILHIGSFREPKNHLFLIDCFNALNPQKNNYKLILVGSGGLLNTVKEKVKGLGLFENVFFAGFDMNVNKYLKKSHLLFFPSINEGLANVLIEAQYKKLPICASNIAPLYESGYKEYHQYYFNPTDKEMTIQNLNRIIVDIQNGDLEKTIFNARKYVVDTFSINIMVSKLIHIYNMT